VTVRAPEDVDLEAVARTRIFGVRHHSPRASATLTAFLEEVLPERVLVEGPCDAGALIDVLVDDATKPPIAILGYRTDGAPDSSLWPLASYSPEYTALRWARRRGIPVAFIDIEVGRALVRSDEREAPTRDIHAEIAAARGLRSFEEHWEADFEAPPHAHGPFREAILGYADAVRASGDRAYHRARDAFMARRIAAVIAEGVAPERIAVVVGAAHAAALLAREVDPSLEAALPAPAPSAATLIPYSFPRLAEQTGYGAGNRAPQYYQRAHDAGCDFRRATLEVLVDFTEHLRLRGFAASLADTIEAYRLAVALADLRGKTAPGLDEVREATIAAICRGDAAQVTGFLWPSVIGKDVGHVAERIGRNSLQEEFRREVRERRLPDKDQLEAFTLKLQNDVEVGTSVFLHRLRLADVPYAGFTGLGRARGGRSSREAAEEPGGQAALARIREAWEAQWTPATDVALVERIVKGDTLEQVATRALEERLAAARTAADAAHILLESVVAACPRTAGAALRACDALAAVDEDLPSLARACRSLSGLVAYGSSRARTALGDEAIEPLCRRTFDRAVLRVPGACAGDDEAVAPAALALRTLHDVALSQPLVDRAAWLDAARALVASYAVNPLASGTAAGLLYIAQTIGEEEVAAIVAQRVSNALEPARVAGFLSGFLSVNALVLVKSRSVVAALDGFLCGLDPQRFRDALPVLRRGFGALGATERRYLLENLVAVRGLGEKARAAQRVLVDRDTERLKAMGTEIAKAMDDLDDLL